MRQSSLLLMRICGRPSPNPKGIAPSSPGCEERATLGNSRKHGVNPNGFGPRKRRNPFGVGSFSFALPRVARSICRQSHGLHSVEASEEAILTVGATGEAPLSYQWHKNRAPLPGATEPTLVIREATSADAGSYHVAVSNRLGSVASDAVTVMVSTAWLFNALDTSEFDPGGGMVWTTGGDKSWLALTISPGAHDKQDAAVSGLIGHNQESWIERTVAGPIILSFWWKVSSDDADFLRFYLGGVETASISGEVNWRNEAFVLPAGEQSLRWEYTKNTNVNVSTEGGSTTWLFHPALP